MPIYDYLCECGHISSDFETISKRKEKIPCEACGKLAPRTYANPDRDDGGDKPRASLSMAVRPEDVPKAMKKWPGSRYNKEGHLLLSGRAEKKLRMKQRGLIEL